MRITDFKKGVGIRVHEGNTGYDVQGMQSVCDIAYRMRERERCV